MDRVRDVKNVCISVMLSRKCQEGENNGKQLRIDQRKPVTTQKHDDLLCFLKKEGII